LTIFNDGLILIMMMMLMLMLMMMMMMMMRRLSSLQVRAKPRHLPYIYIYILLKQQIFWFRGFQSLQPRRCNSVRFLRVRYIQKARKRILTLQCFEEGANDH